MRETPHKAAATRDFWSRPTPKGRMSRVFAWARLTGFIIPLYNDFSDLIYVSYDAPFTTKSSVTALTEALNG